MTNESLVFGLGSSHGDDQAGWLVIDELLARGWPPVLAKRAQQPLELLDWYENDRALVVCDACEPGRDSGPFRCWNWPTDRLPTVRGRGTHDLGLTEVLELGVTLGRLPPHIQLWTIEGTRWSPDSEASAEVRASAMHVAQAIDEGQPHA